MVVVGQITRSSQSLRVVAADSDSTGQIWMSHRRTKMAVVVAAGADSVGQTANSLAAAAAAGSTARIMMAPPLTAAVVAGRKEMGYSSTVAQR